MKKLGILVPVVTPCSRKGAVDEDGLRAVCSDVLSAGCDSIFVAGSTGRGPWFSRSDRSRICRAAADVVGADALLFGGCMGSGLNDMLENARAMADSGARIAVVTAPGYFNYSQAEVEVIFRQIADRSPLPVMIYDIPAFAGMKLDLELASRLATHDNVIGFKDSSADLLRFRELARVLGHASRFYLLQGKEHLLADSLRAGASGFVVSLVQIDPRPFVTLYSAVEAGDMQRADEIQGRISGLLSLVDDAFRRRPETSTLFHLLNQALRMRGVCENIMLEHEGECPGWLMEAAQQALEIMRVEDPRERVAPGAGEAADAA
jgi:dihydrodipicolinate synthase/N-acetylneuraminate lyase